MAVRIQFRRGTAAEWTSANPTLAAGELGYETDTAQIKIGNGTSDWDSLAYAAVSASYVDDAIANVVGLAPETLDTLNELAAALGDDPDFLSGISSDISNAIAHGEEYTNNAIANLVATAPEALNTLNELAAALGDDANFSTTVTTALSHRIEYVVDSAANFVSENPVVGEHVLAIELDTGNIKIGDGVNAWNTLVYANEAFIEDAISSHNSQTTSVHGIDNTANLVTSSELTSVLEGYATAVSLNDYATIVYLDDYVTETALTTTLDGYVAESELATTLEDYPTDAELSATLNDYVTETALTTTLDTTLANYALNSNLTNYALVSDLEDTNNEVALKAPLDGPVFTGNVDLPSTTLVAGVSIGSTTGVHISLLSGVTSSVQDQLDSKAPINSPTFTGTVELPTNTTIGNVSSDAISALENVSSDIQSQLDSKLGSSLASTTYAPLVSPTFTGTVALPADTSIGNVSSTELSYISTLTSNAQTQLDSKAPLESPTFTGTVSGITAGMVGLGNVDNTSDLDKPISNAVQTALDAKLSLAGGTMTGKITLDGDPTQALHATTKQYVDNVSSGILAKPSVIAATTTNLTATYSNGTDGVGATLTATSNGAFPQIDGVSVTTVNGQRGVLVKNQTDPAENGRYNLTTQGDENTPWVLTRCGLCDQASEIPGAYVFVTDGTVNGQTGWVQHVDDPATFTVGTDDIDVFQFAGSGAVTAGNNISVAGNEVSLVDAPVFTDTITVSSEGIEFSDGTVQTSAGVVSLTSFTEKTANYTLDTLAHKDNVVEMNSSSATTFTIPTNASLAWPVGASMDIIQTGSGQVTISPDSGVTLQYTPGNKLRTQWSSCTIIKRSADLWYMYGDLTA